MWDPCWDEIFAQNEWGKYPPEELIRFIARNYYSVPVRADIKILEVGSGPGANVWYMAREGFSVTGLDGSSVGVEKARARLAQEGVKAEFVVGDATQLRFADAFFDCVVDNECIYANSMADSKKIIADIFRVLKPGGRFFMKTFMTGTTGGLREGSGLIRLTAEEDIAELCGRLNVESIDQVIRSDKNRSYEIKEWIIVCRKA